jgi:hypothetical protein
MANEAAGGALAAFMKNDGAVALSKEARAQALAEALDDSTTGDGDVVYLSFSGQGANFRGWQMGRDKTSPDPEAVYVIDPSSIVEGWNVWKGGSVAFKAEWSVFKRSTDRVQEHQLPDHGPYNDGDGPQKMMGVSLFDTDEPGRQIKFTTTSKSGRNALGDILKEVMARIAGDEPEVPIIMLDSEKFTAQGKINGKPKIAVEGWVTPEEVHAFIQLGDDGDLETLLNGGYAVEKQAEQVPEDAAVDGLEPSTAAPARARRARRSAA